MKLRAASRSWTELRPGLPENRRQAIARRNEAARGPLHSYGIFAFTNASAVPRLWRHHPEDDVEPGSAEEGRERLERESGLGWIPRATNDEEK